MVTGMFDRIRTWLNERRAHLNLFDETLADRQHNPVYLLGPMLYFFWLVVVVSGVLLMIWYEPTITGAFTSIERIQNEVPLGWLVRGLHKYSGDAVITASFLRLWRMFLAEYKRPGELSWMLAFLALILAMVSGITGYTTRPRAGHGRRPQSHSHPRQKPEDFRPWVRRWERL